MANDASQRFSHLDSMIWDDDLLVESLIRGQKNEDGLVGGAKFEFSRDKVQSQIEKFELLRTSPFPWSRGN